MLVDWPTVDILLNNHYSDSLRHDIELHPDFPRGDAEKLGYRGLRGGDSNQRRHHLRSASHGVKLHFRS
jgi:hypothetical protein